MLFLASQNTLAAIIVYVVNALNFRSNSPSTAKKTSARNNLVRSAFGRLHTVLFSVITATIGPYILNITVYCYLCETGKALLFMPFVA
jgi:hypothetical protein